MSPALTAAIATVSGFDLGDAVTVTVEGREYEMTVTRGPHRCDGTYGSAESTRITVSLGLGRYSTEVTAEGLASGRQAIRRTKPETVYIPTPAAAVDALGEETTYDDLIDFASDSTQFDGDICELF